MLIEQKITKEHGLKPEDCTALAQAASRFLSEVYLIKNKKRVNAKSVMGLISLNIKKDEVIFLQIDGVDETEARTKLLAVLKGGN